MQLHTNLTTYQPFNENVLLLAKNKSLWTGWFICAQKNLRFFSGLSICGFERAQEFATSVVKKGFTC